MEITAITEGPEWNHFRVVILNINLPLWIITVNEIIEHYFHFGYKYDELCFVTMFWNNVLGLRFHHRTILNVKLKNKLEAP